MNDAIQPLAGTYFSLLPMELRQLLYLYFNTVDLTYYIRPFSHVTYILTSLDIPNINWFHVNMVFDKEYMKPLRMIDMANLIRSVKNKMMLLKLKDNAEIAINPVTKLDVNYFSANVISLRSYLDNYQHIITSSTNIPICLSLVEFLEKVYDALKKE